MKDRFTLLLSLKTPNCFEVFGEFGIGDDRPNAVALFDSLQGNNVLNELDVLHIDLIEADGPLPAKVQTKSCRLDELAANCKLITREVFRQKNLNVHEE
ncbi:hypothetical protein [Mucilaginibacter myungsuensis]|uniref:Uncharacterized protein n=1 Tax=Mucilaginibacter myungsuensis TaxID=649104 RepID=A0A929PWT4_9SPHI|nr:hypothetical protein [Mucilaginibacter myungsuensis]MBE9663168.1 hypothetical protein [Mucilaginibacter myungsuensis]MDN3598803.1 hypothetical protein [Mucilaginibacter myungsuensis]